MGKFITAGILAVVALAVINGVVGHQVPSWIGLIFFVAIAYCLGGFKATDKSEKEIS